MYRTECAGFYINPSFVVLLMRQFHELLNCIKGAGSQFLLCEYVYVQGVTHEHEWGGGAAYLCVCAMSEPFLLSQTDEGVW